MKLMEGNESKYTMRTKHGVLLALAHVDRVSKEELFPHEGTVSQKHPHEPLRGRQVVSRFVVQHTSTSDQFKTNGFCVQAGEIANVLLHGADIQLIVCIWHIHLVCWQVVRPVFEILARYVSPKPPPCT